jgi:hypothetical protein
MEVDRVVDHQHTRRLARGDIGVGRHPDAGGQRRRRKKRSPRPVAHVLSPPRYFLIPLGSICFGSTKARARACAHCDATI